MKKWLSLVLVIGMILLSVPSISFAKDDESTISPKEAIAAALYQVVLDQKTNDQSPWKGKNVKAQEPVGVYNASDEIISYIVNLEVDNHPAGFVEIGNNQGDFPTLSYGYQSNRMDAAEISRLSQKADKKAKKSEKIVWLAPGKFGLKSDYTDGSAEITLDHEKISLNKEQNKSVSKQPKSINTDSKVVWGHIKKLTTGEIGSDSDGVTDDLSFESGYSSASSKYFPGVGDADQYTSSLWTGWSGCSPTSAYNVMYYWHYSKGKSNLLKNSSGYVDRDSAIRDMRVAMGTWTDPETDEGVTTISNIAPGMVTYAKNHGYSTAAASNHSSPSWATVKSDLAYPSVITFTGQTFYNNGDSNRGHTVTGVGYIEYFYNGNSSGHQYMRIHDNWDTTVEDVYVSYGRNYSSLWSVSFKII